MLQYKTRRDVSPQGKPKVYFSCIEEDLKYFDSISEDILKINDCAIWYLEDNVRDGDFLESLLSMQLMVLPVTRRLLTEENDSISVDLRLATEKSIPVLPIMLEKGLDALFNSKCGDIQYLDKNGGDVTAISYEEKLKKYLDSVLLGEELLNKIRSAFDAYVFLSYRKKDRKYARELMRLIHENELLRDIAIWYDEFLVPGESFNDAIKDAIKRSRLFVLTVTPNIVNEPNYIMTTEYPMALHEEKPILPVTLVETDGEQLNLRYHGISQPKDAHNSEELSSALIEGLNIALRKNGTPEHNFFIGLAYLGGVDVEVDYKKALISITDAAEKGLPEASGKLFDMYLNGIGVQRSLETALLWLEKKLEQLEDRLSEDGSLERNRELIENYRTLGQFLTKTAPDTERAREVYFKMSLASERAYDRFKEEEFELNYTESVICTARCEYILENIDRAEELLEKIKSIGERKKDGDIHLLNVKALYYELLARIEEKKGGEKTEEYLLKNRGISYEIYDRESNDHNGLNYAIACLELAQYNADKMNPMGGKSSVEKGCPIAREIAEKTGSLYAGEVYVRFMLLLAKIKRFDNDIQGVTECYATNIENLERSDLTPVLSSLLIESYKRIKEHLFNEKQYEDALLYAKKSEYTFKKLLPEGNYQLYLLGNGEFMARCYEGKGENNQALQIYEYLENAYRDLYVKMPNEFCIFYMLALLNVAEIYCKTHNYAPSVRQYKALISFAKKRFEDMPAVRDKATEYISSAYDGIISVHIANNKKLKAFIYAIISTVAERKLKKLMGNKSEQEKTEQEQTEQEKAESNKSEQVSSEQENAQGNNSAKEKTESNKTEQE